MLEILAHLPKVLPRVKTPLQLVGLLFTVFAWALIRKVDPSNVQALAVVGGIGVALVAIPLAFQRQVLWLIPEGQRVFFLLFMLALLLFSFSASALYTYKVVSPTKMARFDTEILPESVRIEKIGDLERVYLKIKAFPLSTDPDEGATVFIGLVVVHDETKGLQGSGIVTPAVCAEVDSCLGSFFYKDLSERPILVRPNTPGSPITLSVDIKPGAKLLKIWWEFYQREGVSPRHLCVFDQGRIGPVGGIPPLVMQEAGVRQEGGCYRSFGNYVFKRAS